MRTQKFLVVRLAGREFALPAARIRGMVKASGLTLTPLEGDGPRRYAVIVDGTNITVVVPNAALGLPERPVSGRTALLLIDQRWEALLVDSISHFVDVNAECFRPPSRVRLGQKWRTVLDPDNLSPTSD